MADKKLDPMAALKSKDTKLRNAAMVYLHEDNQTPFEFLAAATKLALSTVKTYVRSKFAHLLDWARSIFCKAKNIIRKKAEEFWCYIDRITMPNGEVWCKIGQTTQTPERRARGMFWTQNGKKVKPEKVEVMHAIKCKDETAMTNMEDCLRLGMTAINPEMYKKNDRLLCWEDDYPQRILENDFVKMGLPQFAITA